MGFSTFPNNPFPPSSAQFDYGKNELATKTNLSNIAPEFDATSGIYAVGDKVIYDGVLYEFTSAHSTVGEWDENEVQPVKVSELIDSLKSGLTNQGTYSTTPVKIGNWLGNDLYRKVVEVGKLLNSDNKRVASGLTNERVVNIYGYAADSSYWTLPLPFISASAGTDRCELAYDTSNHTVSISTNTDLSGFSAIVVVEYYTVSG